MLFSDPDPLDTYATHVSLWADDRKACSLVVVDTALAQLDRETLASIIRQKAPSHRRLICTGFSAAGREALSFSRLLNADAVLAVAPDWDRGMTGVDLDGLLNGSSPADHILLGQDGTPTVLRQAAGVSQQDDLSSVALPVALQQSGLLAAALDALVEGRALPSFDGVSEQWRQGVDYRLEINPQDVYYDISNALHVSGRIHNKGRTPFAFDATDRILIGGKILGPNLPQEARGALSKPKLDPGENAPFRLTFPSFNPDAGDSGLEIGLLCEGRFWFNWVGFPALRFELGRQSSSVPTELPASSSPALTAERLESSTLANPLTAPTEDRPATPDDVVACYNAFLRRAPENERVISEHLKDSPRLGSLIHRFMTSPEALHEQQRATTAVEAAPSSRMTMIQATDLDWIKIGEDEPYHGVLSHEKFLRRNLTPETLSEFWRSGAEEIAYLKGMLERHFGEFQTERALDFGCGVGRLTRAMAEIAATVVGLDIAPGMLTEASRGAPTNITFTDELGARTFDWINSIIVFQHIPPSRGYALFEDLVRRLEPGGVLSVQFTLYRDQSFLPRTIGLIEEASWDGETIRALNQTPAPAGTMLMYDYDLTRLLACVVRHGLEQLFLEHTNHGGCHGVRFFARRVS